MRFIFILSLICLTVISFSLSEDLKIPDIKAKINGSYYATNPWGKDDNNNCELLPFISLQESYEGDQYLIVKFDPESKLPIFSIYEHNYLTDINALPRLNPFYDYPCERLKGHVLKDNEYTNTGWSRGHLSPQMAFRYSEEARAASNYLVNIAPQDLHSNTQPWSQIEQKLHKFFFERKAIVITGTCEKYSTRRSGFRATLPVPDCYWKIACTKDNSNVVTAAAFYHRNIMSTTAEQKEHRNQEIFQVRDPQFVEGLISPLDWNSLWNEAEKYLDPVYDGKPSIKFSDCYKARLLTTSGRKFWENAIGVFEAKFDYID